MRRNRVVCLEIGSAYVRAITGTLLENKIANAETVTVPVEGVVLGIVSDVEKCTLAVKKALAEVKAKAEEPVVVIIGNYYIESLKTTQSKYIDEDKKITENDLDDLLEKAEQAYLKGENKKIDILLQHYNVDELANIQKPVGMQCAKLEAVFNIFSCRKTLLSTIENCVQSAGYQVEELLFAPYYASETVFNEEEEKGGVLLIDMGADITRASVFIEGALYASFAIPFGGRSITRDIKNSYPVSQQQAEKLKLQFGVAASELAEENAEVMFIATDVDKEKSLRVNDLSGVIECRVDEIFRGIHYQLRKINLETEFESIVLLGSGSLLTALPTLLERRFKVPVRLATFKAGLFADENGKDISVLNFASLAGALRYELHENRVESKEERKESFFKRAARTLFGALSTDEKDTKI